MVIEKLGIKVTRKLDTGYSPYMEYLEELGNRSPAFGTRENSYYEADVYIGAVVEEGDDVNEVIDTLSEKAQEKCDALFEARFPGALASEDAEMFTVQETEVDINPDDF